MTSELTRWVASLGHSEITLRSDQEPVCLALQKLVQAQRLRLGLRTHLEQTEPDDHAANAAEPAVESLRQLTNTILAEFESSASCKVSSLDATHAWCWRHANSNFIQHRFTRSQGQTPFELSRGRPYLGRLVCFGETVYGRLRRAAKGQARLGLWLGKLPRSDGHVLFTASGHFMAHRSIRRLPDRYMRSADLAKKLKDHPAFLAGQLGQVRPQKTVDVPAQAHAQAGEAQASEVQAPAPEVPGEVARDAPVEPPPHASVFGSAENRPCQI